MKKIILGALTPLMLFGLLACSDGQAEVDAQISSDVNPEIQAILDNGALRVGVKNDAPKLGYYNAATGQYEGLEIDLANMLAERIFNESGRIDLRAVTADNRGTLLSNGDLDMVIATFTIRDERKEFWNFSQPYFTGSAGLLVEKDAGLNSLEDFDGRTIAVTKGSVTQNAIETVIAEKGLDITPIFVEFPTNLDCAEALDAGQVDAFSVDKAILAGYLTDTRVILPYAFKPQEYGIATRLNSPYLTRFVDDFISEIKADGTLENLVQENGLVQ